MDWTQNFYPPPDDDHPYGHGKAEPIAAAVVSLTLIAAAVIIIIQSVREILIPHHAPAAFTLIVLVLVVVTKETLFRFVFNVGQDINSTAVKGDAWHHRSDAITSAAAFIGISISLIGGVGYESADDWAALFASVIILFNAYRILRPAINEVMDSAPSADVDRSIRQAVQHLAGVMVLKKCSIRKMGFSYYVDIDVTVNGELSVRHGHDIAQQVKQAICASNPNVAGVLVHVEPFDLPNE